MKLRCPSRIFAVLVDGRFEVKCSSSHCGAGKGSVVFHYFDPADGKLLETKRFKDPESKFRKSTKKEATATCR